MDATTAPHLIPPEMLQYGEDNHIFEMMQNMLEQVLIHQPEDPITFMINHLRRNNDSVPKVVILGPPASGKTTIAMWLCKHLNSNLITKENLLEKEFSQMAEEAKRHYEIYKRIPNSMLISLVQERLNEDDCLRRRLWSMGSVEQWVREAAGPWNMWSVENVVCGECGPWSTGSMEQRLPGFFPLGLQSRSWLEVAGHTACAQPCWSEPPLRWLGWATQTGSGWRVSQDWALQCMASDK